MTASADNPLTGVRLVAFDVDGVFTDGRLYLSDHGIESKAFNTQDGYGVRCLVKSGIAVAIISGRSSGAVAKRMQDLDVKHVIQGCRDKIGAFEELVAELGITDDECVYVGDDLPDLPLLHKVGYSIAVANAVPELKSQCDYTTRASGGNGAVREVCDLVLAAQSEAD